MKVKDIMEPVTDFLTPELTLLETVQKMKDSKRKHGLAMKGMVVLDNGALTGIVSLKDILKATMPAYLDEELSNFTWEGMLEELTIKAGRKHVKEFMSKKIITVFEEDSLMKCVDLLIRLNLQRLPVLNQAGKLVGMVYVRDLYDFVTRIFHAEEGEAL